jgi:hypothetical protein
MKRKRLTEDDVAEALVNKELEKYNVTVDHVIANPTIDGKPWYDHYTCTEEEYETFKTWAIDFVSENLRIAKYRAKSKVSLFCVIWGLAIEPTDTKNT